MPGWITTVLSGVAAFFGWRHAKAEKDLRDMDQEAGATKQQNADMKATIDAQKDQLKKAVNRRANSARKRLRSGDF